MIAAAKTLLVAVMLFAAAGFLSQPHGRPSCSSGSVDALFTACGGIR
jgi:hypothetical protein